MRKILILFIIIYVTYGIFSKENTVIELSIEDALKSAEEHNIHLKITNLDFFEKNLNAATVWNKLLPSVSATTSIGKSEMYDTIVTFDGTTDRYTLSDAFSYGINTAYTFNARVIFDIQRTVLDRMQGKITLEKSKKRLHRDIKKYYYNLVVLQESIKLKQTEQVTKKQRYEDALLRYNNGELSQLEVLRKEYAYKSHKAALEKEENNYRITLYTFRKIIGIEKTYDILLVSPLPDINGFDLSSLDDRALDTNPDIREILMRIRKERNSRNSAIALLTPSVSLSYSLTNTYAHPGRIQAFDRDAQWDATQNWRTLSRFNVVFSYGLDSLVPFSKEQTSLIAYQTGIKKLQLELDNKRQELTIQMVSIITTLKQITGSLESLRLNRDIAHKAYLLSEQAYKDGLKSFLEVAEAEEDLQNAEQTLLVSHYEYLTKLFELEYLLNREL